MGNKILEFCLGMLAGVVALMAVAYMSAAMSQNVRLKPQTYAAAEPEILPTPAQPLDTGVPPVVTQAAPVLIAANAPGQ